MDGEKCRLSIESGCEAVQSLAEELKEVQPFREISFKGEKGPPYIKSWPPSIVIMPPVLYPWVL